MAAQTSKSIKSTKGKRGKMSKMPTLLSSEEIRAKLKLKHLETKAQLLKKHKKALKHLSKKGVDPSKLREHSAKVLGAGAVAGTLLLTAPHTIQALPAPEDLIREARENTIFTQGEANTKNSDLLLASLRSVLPSTPRPLSRNEEKLVEKLFENIIGVKARATLEGEHLNTTYGKIGAEQHLYRYPGDNLSLHGSLEIQKEGIAPGKGAWGYFAQSKEELTPELEEIEKWYAVVQTLYLPDWNTRQPYLKNWYKYRKVLIVNTLNGKAVIASIADSGPAAFTGKHYGGSPEVMDYLGGERYKKGPVILFFVDDPKNEVPLGPVEYNNVKNIPTINVNE